MKKFLLIVLHCLVCTVVKASDPIIYYPQYWCEHADLYDKNNIWEKTYEDMVGIVINLDKKLLNLRIGSENIFYTIVSCDRVRDMERWNDENVFIFKALDKITDTKVLFIIRAETNRVKIFLYGNETCIGWMETN